MSNSCHVLVFYPRSLAPQCSLHSTGYSIVLVSVGLLPSSSSELLIMDSAPHQASNHHHSSPLPLPAASSGNAVLFTSRRPRSAAARGEPADAVLFLATPAGWLIHLAAFLGEHVAAATLSFVFPVAALVGHLRALPGAIAANVRRAAVGLLAAACTFAVLVSALLASALLGFVLVRLWVEEPVTVRRLIYFDYTEPQPSAAVALGRAGGAVLPAGHSVRVSLALVLPDSYHNREVGMFQLKAEAVSVTGITTASATQPYMLRYKSTPVRLAQSALMCVPLTLGIRSETQTASLKVLQYREGHGRSKRTGLIRVLLQPRAATVQLPQVYRAEIVVQSTLPWTKGLARGLKWTLCVWVSFSVYVVLVVLAICLVRPLAVSARKNRRLSELQVDEKMVSDMGDGGFGGSPSMELSGSDAMKQRRERRGKRKGEFQMRSHGGRRELEFAEGSTSDGAVVETADVTK